jgi:DNA topoisomerase I
MAKKSTENSGKSLVIVESPAKARTIGKFLGKQYHVEASIGHVRDLPSGKKEMPTALKNEPWARLGVNVDNAFTPVYVIPDGKKKQVDKLKKLLQECDSLYLATDEDREGEAISWHLAEILKPKVPVHRLVFHEITKTAISQALESPREIDDALVRAQETRRILDRLYGYEMSEFLWKKSLGRSAGRVQSVAVRLIVERERDRMAFVTASYWDLIGEFVTDKNERVSAELVSVDGKKIPDGKDFDSTTGKIKGEQFLVMDEKGAQALAARLAKATFKVTNVEVKPYTRAPAAPFTTSTLQQEANRKLGFTARRTMNAAQSLYENGHITYMRTDSTTLAAEAVDAARALVRAEYGGEFLPDTPRTYVSKVKNAQEAHEAIRPTGQPFPMLGELRGKLRDDEFRLYELIWKRTMASQMVNARGNTISVTIEGGGAVFQCSGKTIDFAGFLRAYVEGSDDPESELADQEKILPDLKPEQRLECAGLQEKYHSTQPPARFSEAALTRELEKRGIGRPSTYASIIETVQARDYVVKRGTNLVPTWAAFAVVRMLEEHFPNLVDYEFTALLEDKMDAISRREFDNVSYLQQFYFGNGVVGLKRQLETKIKEVDARAICTFPLGTPAEGEFREVVNVRVGRYGPYVEQGDRKATLPNDLAPDELTLAKAVELLSHAQIAEAPLGYCPETKRPVYMKQGRFGPYVQLGTLDDDDEEEKPKNSSLLKGMTPDNVTLETALQLLSLPRNLGEHPETNETIMAYNGKFGPYVKAGAETRSLPGDMSILQITRDQAVELLKQPKRGRGQAAAKAPLKILGDSPITGKPIQVLDGRYGPYVADGETNASLPKDAEVESLTIEQALMLLAERAAKGGSKKKAKRAPKKAVAKKTPKKASPKKATKSPKAAKKAAKKSAIAEEQPE